MGDMILLMDGKTFPLIFTSKGVQMNTRNLGAILLAVYLILTGISALGLFSFSSMDTIAGICALAAGVLLLLNR